MTATEDLLARLQRHYIKPGNDLPGGVFIPEVGQNGGWGAGSRCDAIYVGFTSSSGRLLVGHELKISRSDWLNELSKAGKADAWADECHEWWLVVSDPAIVHDGELPAHWGLMVPNPRTKTRMTIHTRAVRKDPFTHRPSWDAVRSIIARQDTLRANAIRAGIQKADSAMWAEQDKRVRERVEAELARRKTPEAAVLQDRLDAIEAALGGRIDWDAEERGYILAGREYVGLSELKMIADAVRAAGSVEAAVRSVVGRYGQPLKTTRDALDRLTAALTELRNTAPAEVSA